MGVQEVRRDKGEQLEQGIKIFSMENETKIINRIRDVCTPQNSIGS